MSTSKRLPLALFLLRASVFLVMFMWTLDKFVRPTHAVSIFEYFYGLSDLGPMLMRVLGALELVLLLGFVLGLAQRFTYGVVLLLHTASTLAAYPQYWHAFEEANLLFFGAWPMLAAAFALYYLREFDTYRLSFHSTAGTKAP